MLVPFAQLSALFAAWAIVHPVNADDTSTFDYDDLNSSIDDFLSSLDSEYTSFDYNGLISSANSLIGGLTEFGLTPTPLVDISDFLATATPGASINTDGPYVPDIVSSFSQFAATRTGSEGFTFDTSGFQSAKSTEEAAAAATSTAGSSEPTAATVVTQVVGQSAPTPAMTSLVFSTVTAAAPQTILPTSSSAASPDRQSSPPVNLAALFMVFAGMNLV